VVGIFRKLKWAHVGSEAEEADRFQKAVRLGFVLDGKSALFEQGQLRRNINGWLAEGLHAEKQSGIKNPLNLCVAAEATIGMAGVLRERLCISASFCKKFGTLSQALWHCSDGRTSTRKLLRAPRMQEI